MNNRPHLLLTFLLTLWLYTFIGSSSSQADSVPAVLQQGKTYIIRVAEVGDWTCKILEIDKSGWIRVQKGDQTFWLNVSHIQFIRETK